jgi:hypothetical protein
MWKRVTENAALPPATNVGATAFVKLTNVIPPLSERHLYETFGLVYCVP